MEKLELTAPEIQKRLDAGERVCLYSASGVQSRVLGVEDPVGGLTAYKIAFRGFVTGMALTLDAAPDRKLHVVIVSTDSSPQEGT